jgi:UDP-2,4-diacetamido-2,4,6-trideoxy-beta-L-altropyranose hydrolase
VLFRSKVLKALQEIPDKNCEIRIVAGAGNPYFKDLQALIKNMQGDIQLIQHAQGIATLMQWADLAVASAGITSWELSFMGVPSLLMVLAENQRSNAERLDETGIAINLGWYEHLAAADIAHAVNQLLGDFNRRSEMAQRGRNLIDGHGVERVLRCMLHKSFTIRQATENDCKLLWEWANDPDVRSGSFSSDFIPWEQHVEWFHQKLRDPNYRIYIAVGTQGTPIGQVRYEIRQEESMISVSLDKHYRGQGYGSVVIKKACEELFSDSDILKVHAYIRTDNKASVVAFTNAGFKDLGATMIKEHKALHFILCKTTNGGNGKC